MTEERQQQPRGEEQHPAPQASVPEPFFRRDIFREFDRMRNELNRVFDQFLTPFRDGLMGWAGQAAFNIQEDEKELKVYVDLPRMDANDIEITAAENYITVHGEKREQQSVNKENYQVKEQRFGSFQTTIPLPKPVKAEEAEANYNNDVLEIRLPKKDERRPEQIRIRVNEKKH